MATACISTDDRVRVTDLRTQEQGGGGFVGVARPSLSWRLAASREAVVQRGYEVEVAHDHAFVGEVERSGPVTSMVPTAAPWPAANLTSRAFRWVRVRVLTDAGWTAWSAPLRVEAALLADDDWRAMAISPPANLGRRNPGPVPLLRRAFFIDRPVVCARLYVTAQGITQVWLNGTDVGDALLEPGWTSYPHRLLYAAHDVTAQIAQGENVLAAAVADGWWRGWLTWEAKRAIYGDTTALIAQLEIVFEDGTTMTVASDGNWIGGFGAWRAADLYNGCETDLRYDPPGWRLPGFAGDGWQRVATLPRPSNLILRPMPPVRVVDRWPVAVTRTDRGTIAMDCGQNLAGFLRLSVRGKAGAAVTVRHAEMLDDDGTLYTAPLRGAMATDRYVLADDALIWLEPAFTFHGFRFAEVVSDANVSIEAAEVCAISSAVDWTGRFECSDARINRLYENVRWSQLGNFVTLPTDCPQRDERMGWTGDIQVFADTACINADVRSLLASWLRDLAAEQRADGNVTSTVPNVVPGFVYEYGGVGWGDAATLVPWSLYEAFGDAQVLADQFDSMTRWVEYGASRLKPDGTWSGDFHLGDWLDPGAPSDAPHLATTDRDFIATAYLSHSARTLAKAATVLDRRDAADRYAVLADAVSDAAWTRWHDAATSTQTGCAMALQFGIVPPARRAAVAATLAALVDGCGGRIAAGFLGTPLVLRALSDNGQVDAAYRLLFNPHCPGWLYQVDRGATTMWERWDAVQEDGRLHAGQMAVSDGASMISFNHYAFGAVAAWLYRTVAGIAPDPACTATGRPAYGAILFAPCPGGDLTHAEAQVDTVYGRSGISWRIAADGMLRVTIEIAAGAVGRFVVPAGWHELKDFASHLGSGRHVFRFMRSPRPDGGAA